MLLVDVKWISDCEYQQIFVKPTGLTLQTFMMFMYGSGFITQQGSRYSLPMLAIWGIPDFCLSHECKMLPH